MRCTHCGEPAGFLRRSHRECRESHAEGVLGIAAAVADAGLGAEEAHARIEELAGRHRVRDGAFDGAVGDGWAEGVRSALGGGGLSRAEEGRLDSLLSLLGRSRSDVDRWGLGKQVRKARLDAGKRRVGALLHEAMRAREKDSAARPLEEIGGEIEATLDESGLGRPDLRPLLVDAMEKEIDRALADELLSKEEEEALMAVVEHFELDRDTLEQRGGWMRLTKAAVLRDLAEGVVPQRIILRDLRIPFRLQKSETLIWVFKNVGYNTIRTRTEFQGGHAGVSIRVAKGLYFRTGGFRGRPVQTSEMVHVDDGLLGVTTRHIYFTGAVKSFRIRHNRVVSIEPYTDGVGVMRDGARAKPEVFELDDGWFAYNLLHNIEVP